MKMKKVVATALAAAMICSLFLTGCGSADKSGKSNLKSIKKHGIQMEDYLTLSVEGQDGYGKLYAELDIDRLREDCSNFLVSSVEEIHMVSPNCYTVEDYLERSLDVDTYEVVDCDTVMELSNGDKLEVYVDVPDDLDRVLTVEVNASVVEYTVKGLEEFKGVDPFQFACCSYVELATIDGEVGYKLVDALKALVLLPDGDHEYLYCSVDVQEDKIYKRSDSVRVYLSDDVMQRYTERYGDNLFTRTEMELSLETMGYLPTGNQAADVFTYMDEKSLDNAVYATKHFMDDCTDTETTVENIGMMFFYDDDGVLNDSSSWKWYNQIVFINKVTNDLYPDGWYTYMAYNGYVGVAYQLNKGTIEMEKCIADSIGSHLDDDYRRYYNEYPGMYRGDYPMSFDYNGVQYPGHRDLTDVFTALTANMSVLSEYDHLIVTDSLKGYVQEY